MSIVLVYHPEERASAQELADALGDKEVDVVMAPLGLQVGSPEWIKQARSDIDAAAVCIFLVSEKSVRDSWVGTRLEWVLARKIPLVPVSLVRPYSIPLNEWTIPKDPAHRQMITFEEATQEGLLYRLIHRFLPLQCFLSYSRRDHQFADRLQQALQDEGILVWRDASSIPGGADWDAEIEKAIRKSSCILIVASKAAFASPNVADEISFARNSKKRIIPILIEEVELPFRIHRAQAINFRGGFEDSLRKLLVSIRGRDSPRRYGYR
jgi:TIR domain-containing protein